MLTPERVIELLGLEPLPVEGGYFRQTYRAAELIAADALPERYHEAKPFGSAIYYFLHRDHFSALHRLRTDEVYHFYLGDPVELLLLSPDGSSELIVLGRDLEAGQRVQMVAPRKVWQGSRLAPGGQFALLGTTMAPAFDPSDFELAERDTLIQQFPERAVLIRALTRAT
jgi:predicted cupin superfamily sugar epimerase